jgi:hypothetical protein
MDSLLLLSYWRVVVVVVVSAVVSLPTCSGGPKVRGVAKTVLTLGIPVIVVAVAITTIAVITAITRIFIQVISNKHVHDIFNHIV